MASWQLLYSIESAEDVEIVEPLNACSCSVTAAGCVSGALSSKTNDAPRSDHAFNSDTVPAFAGTEIRFAPLAFR